MTQILKIPTINKSIPWDFFDGASQGDPPLGGSGAVIFILEEEHIAINYGPGHCNNNKVELAALWAVLEAALTWNLLHLQIFGD